MAFGRLLKKPQYKLFVMLNLFSSSADSLRRTASRKINTDRSTHKPDALRTRSTFFIRFLFETISALIGNSEETNIMTEIAREAGLGRESLYKALAPEGNPEFATVMKVLRALGLSLHVKTAHR
jgi:DNA-binding phage protein